VLRACSTCAESLTVTGELLRVTQGP
jgi:hypothetical protein